MRVQGACTVVSRVVYGCIYTVRVQGASKGRMYRVRLRVCVQGASTEYVYRVRLRGACTGASTGCMYRLRLQDASTTKPSEIVIIILAKAQYFSIFLKGLKLHIYEVRASHFIKTY